VPVVPEFPAVCTQLSAITPEGRPVMSESLIVAGPAVLPDPIVIPLDIPPIPPNILAILLDLAPGVPAISPQVRTVAMQSLPIRRESLIVASRAVLTEVTPVMAHTLVHLPTVLRTRARDPQCHSH
jgi:hypothetical protein